MFINMNTLIYSMFSIKSLIVILCLFVYLAIMFCCLTLPIYITPSRRPLFYYISSVLTSCPVFIVIVCFRGGNLIVVDFGKLKVESELQPKNVSLEVTVLKCSLTISQPSPGLPGQHLMTLECQFPVFRNEQCRGLIVHCCKPH